jgi:metal-sulfur cluster biosynthetic enzyme
MASRDEVLEILRGVEDPELGLNIVDLGLVYRVETDAGRIEVDFTLTYPGCPVGPIIREEMAVQLRKAFGVEPKLATVWSPPWGPERMSEEVRVALGYPI